MKPLVSAVIPTRNRSHCLPRAIDSILSQRGLGEEFELETIVVDDGSTDRTEEVLQRYDAVRYIRLPSRHGVSAALNRGVRASEGQFVTFLGDDDEWMPHKLQTQVPLLASHRDIGVVYGQALVRSEGQERLYPPSGRGPSGWVFFDMLLDNFCGHHPAALMRREALEAAGEFDETLTSGEDFDLSLRIARLFPFHFLPGAVTIYNQSLTGQYLSQVASGAAARDCARAIEKALQTLPDSSDYAAIREAARARAALEAAASIAKVGDLVQARERLRATLELYPWALEHEWATRYVRWIGVAP